MYVLYRYLDAFGECHALKAVLNDTRSIVPVSTCVRGLQLGGNGCGAVAIANGVSTCMR